ncbi:MAG: hypothetical protein IJI49_05190 [Bacilli bacterium]|nr:hypothetical protein [Bacilli bacterium]
MNKQYEINEYGLYNIDEITKEFDQIIGIPYNELINYFNELSNKIIKKEDVIEYCNNNYNNLRESKYKKEIDDNIINKRISDYDILYKVLNIYKNKGEKIVRIFQLLKQNNTSKEFEDYLKELDINHYNIIVVGRDLIRLVETLKNIISKYNYYFEIINNFNTYNIENYDALYIKYANAFPYENILNSDENEFDRSSLTRTKKKSYKL